MSLRVSLEHVLDGYRQATAEPFTDHPMASFIRRDLRDELVEIVGDAGRLIFKGSAGQGNWARGPWVAIFDPVITTTAQAGCYPVYLFREDMAGVFISLNQGVTEAKNLYKSDAKTALRARAANYRAMLGKEAAAFPELNIDLAPSASSNDTSFYEAGNICAKYYPAGRLPVDAELLLDLLEMLRLYDVLERSIVEAEASEEPEDDQPPGLDYEDATRFRIHKRIERNPALSRKVKALKGFRCEVCELDFQERYGAIGKGFIEAHHLTPLASLKGIRVALDPSKDFAVLCSNCHRMIHRSGLVEDIQRFKKEHYLG